MSIFRLTLSETHANINKLTRRNAFWGSEKSCWQTVLKLIYLRSCRVRLATTKNLDNWTVKNLEMIPKWEKPHREKWCDQACLRNSILRRWDLANAKSARRSESGFELGYLVHSRTTLNSKFRSDSEYKPDLSGTDQFLKKSFSSKIYFITWEFDPGSGWTLAACLTHASRTKHSIRFLSGMTI